MLNLMKEMKEAGKSDHPINLSTMLSSVDHHLKRQSESSLSPRSPRAHFGHADEDDDDDIDEMDDDDGGVDSSVAVRFENVTRLATSEPSSWLT